MTRIRKGRGFRGGIALDKEPAWQAPIETLPIPDRVVVPLLDSEGRELKPGVRRGDRVKAGDRLAEGRVPLLSPISGTVAGIEPLAHLSGFRVNALKIERLDGEEAFEPPPDFRRLGQQELLEKAWGLGLNLPFLPEKEVEALVVAGLHDDPHSAGAQRLIIESSASIRQGLEILQRIYACQRVFVALEPRPAQALAAWKQMGKALENMVLVKVSGRYPHLEEDLLLSAVLPRKVLRELDSDAGSAFIVEVEEIYLLAEALSRGRPFLEKLVTVAGSGIPSPRNLRVRIGTPISTLLASCGVDPGGLGKVVAGDAMRGWAQFDDRAGIGRDTHSLILISREEAEAQKEETCLRCGWCLEVCPHDLNPARLFEACRSEDWEAARSFGLLECSECGACAWACPSHLKLVHWFRLGKGEFLKRGQDSRRIRAA